MGGGLNGKGKHYEDAYWGMPPLGKGKHSWKGFNFGKGDDWEEEGGEEIYDADGCDEENGHNWEDVEAGEDQGDMIENEFEWGADGELEGEGEDDVGYPPVKRPRQGDY